MENQEARERIISGIAAEAEKQAEEMLREARSASEDRLHSTEARADRASVEEEERTSEHIAKIEREAATRLEAAKRRLGLEMRESVYQEVVSRSVAAFDRLVGENRYEDVVRNWIVEAAAGLQADSARVTASHKEIEVVALVLEQVEALMKEEGRQPIKLSVSEEPPLSRQGIVLIAEDGKTAYNNQVHSRLERYKTEIRKLVHQRLFQDE